MPTALKPAARKPRAEGIRVREQPFQRVQGAGGEQVLAAPPTLVAAQQPVLAEVAPAPACPSTSASAAQSSNPKFNPWPAKRMHHMGGIAQQDRARTHIIEGVLQLQGKTRDGAGQFAIAQDLPAGRRQGSVEGLAYRARAIAPPRASATLHTMDERPSGSGRKATGPDARNRCHAVLPCGFAVRTCATSAS